MTPVRPTSLGPLVLALLLGACVAVGCQEGDTNGNTVDFGPSLPPEGGGTGGGGGEGSPTLGGDAAGGAGGSGGGFAPVEDGGVRGLVDNPVGLLVADPLRSAWGQLGGTDFGAAEDYGAQALACYGSESTCSGESCAVFATCCIDSGNCCVPSEDPALAAPLAFATCDGLDLAGCASTLGVVADGFGPVAPSFTARGLVPGGNITSEGGASFGSAFDLATTKVRADVRFAAPADCGPSCLESAGVAFSGSEPSNFVDAGLGLLLSGSRNEVNLMIGDAVADQFDAASGSSEWSLVASPEGRVEVLRDDVSLGTYAFDPSSLRQASFLVFGRNLNAAPDNAAVRSVEIGTSICDAAQGWESRSPVDVTTGLGTTLPEAQFGERPSIAEGDGERRVAYGLDGEIFWALETGPTLAELITTAPALTPSRPHDAAGAADPELVFDGTAWHLFYTAIDANGVRSIGHATATPMDTSFSTEPNATLVPSGDETSIEAPTVYFRQGLWLLVVRARLVNGSNELRAFYSSEPNTGWARVEGGSLEAQTRVTDAGSEVTDPSLIVHNSAYSLYYARRTGTRWVTELLASDELLVWRSIGESLGASTTVDAFDSEGARGGDAISLTDRIELVYQGQGDVSFRLGRASRPSPSESAPDF
ncbi:MAG: hypothetical protein AAF436_04995 [Myxococcota bacterium]